MTSTQHHHRTFLFHTRTVSVRTSAVYSSTLKVYCQKLNKGSLIGSRKMRSGKDFTYRMLCSLSCCFRVTCHSDLITEGQPVKSKSVSGNFSFYRVFILDSMTEFLSYFFIQLLKNGQTPLSQARNESPGI